MKYAVGIEITNEEAAVALVDEQGCMRLLQEDAASQSIPCLCKIDPTGDVLVGQRAVRYGALSGMQLQPAAPSVLFAYIAQLLKRELQTQTLPPVVLSVRSLDLQQQKALAQAAGDSGLRVVRCINSLAAGAVDLAASVPEAEGQITLTLPVDAAETAFLQAEIDYSDGVWEILSCAESDEKPAGSLYFGGEAGRRNALMSAARGAALLAGELNGLKTMMGLLLMDILTADINLYKNDGTALALLQRDTTIPARVNRILRREEIVNADGQLTFGLGEDWRVCVSLTHPVLRACEELKLAVSVDAKRKITLMAEDAANDFCSQSFTLLELTQDAPAAEPQKAADADEMLSAMLEAMDGLENGLRMLTDAERESSVGKGMLQIHKSFRTALSKMGVEPIPAVGCLFDPRVHEAVVTMPGGESGWVLKEYRRGYLRNGVLLRAAQVMVSEE